VPKQFVVQLSIAGDLATDDGGNPLIFETKRLARDFLEENQNDSRFALSAKIISISVEKPIP